jgi:hypothetical protein
MDTGDRKDRKENVTVKREEVGGRKKERKKDVDLVFLVLI